MERLARQLLQMWIKQLNYSDEPMWKCEEIEKNSDRFTFTFFQKVVVSLVTRANILYGFWSVWANPNGLLWSACSPRGTPACFLTWAESHRKSNDLYDAARRPNNKSCFAGNWATLCVSPGSPESQYPRDFLHLFQQGEDKLMIQCGRQMKLIFPAPDRIRL